MKTFNRKTSPEKAAKMLKKEMGLKDVFCVDYYVIDVFTGEAKVAEWYMYPSYDAAQAAVDGCIQKSKETAEAHIDLPTDAISQGDYEVACFWSSYDTGDTISRFRIKKM